MRALIFGVFALFGCSGERSLADRIDQAAFLYLGGTLISKPQHVAMKEIHLDSGTLLGRGVLVEGALVEVGEHGTYLVAADESGRLLVVLTGLSGELDLGRTPGVPRTVRVFGTINRGRKGLPFLMASAVRVSGGG